MAEHAAQQPVKDANQGTPSAAELRGKTILGDAVVKQEIQTINQIIRAASDTGQVRTVITGGTGIQMAGQYSYGDWWLLEESFLYGTAGKARALGGQVGVFGAGGSRNDEGRTHYEGFSSVTRLGEGAFELTFPEFVKVLKNIDSEIFVKHSRINAVLGHYRKLGYQIHPGNWFDARTKNKIKWVINWNNTIMDHIMMIDNTLVIGKPTNRAMMGEQGKDPTLNGGTGGVPNLKDPQPPQTQLQFFGLGNKGFGQLQLTPADGKLGGANNQGLLAYEENYGGTSYTFDQAGGEALGSQIGDVYSLLLDLAAGVGLLIGELSRSGLISSEVGQLGGDDYSLVGGMINTGDGVTPDILNTALYGPDGEPWNEGYRPGGAGEDYERPEEPEEPGGGL